MKLTQVAAEVASFLLVELGPAVALCCSEHEFLLERLHVLVLSEASLACGWLPTFCRGGLKPLLLNIAWLTTKLLLSKLLLDPHQGVAKYM